MFIQNNLSTCKKVTARKIHFAIFLFSVTWFVNSGNDKMPVEEIPSKFHYFSLSSRRQFTLWSWWRLGLGLCDTHRAIQLMGNDNFRDEQTRRVSVINSKPFPTPPCRQRLCSFNCFSKSVFLQEQMIRSVTHSGATHKINRKTRLERLDGHELC